jgi:predicted nucleic acid-binding protein
MTRLVIDASIAIKWVVEEQGTEAALALRNKAELIAPDLLIAECANILWKKVQRNELTEGEALIAARLLQSANVEILATNSLLETAIRLAIELGHPAYDCIYLALAIQTDCRFVTADKAFVRKISAAPLADRVVELADMPL